MTCLEYTITVFATICPGCSHFFSFPSQFSPFPGIKKGTDFSIPFSAPADFFTNSIFLFVAKLRYLSEV